MKESNQRSCIRICIDVIKSLICTNGWEKKRAAWVYAVFLLRSLFHAAWEVASSGLGSVSLSRDWRRIISKGLPIWISGKICTFATVNLWWINRALYWTSPREWSIWFTDKLLFYKPMKIAVLPVWGSLFWKCTKKSALIFTFFKF